MKVTLARLCSESEGRRAELVMGGHKREIFFLFWIVFVMVLSSAHFNKLGIILCVFLKVCKA